MKPDFISVTYGTGKSADRTATARIAHTIHSEYGIDAVAHLTAQYLTARDVDEALAMFDEAKVSGVLALRGDRNSEREPAGVFTHASDLVCYIRERRPNLKIYGAAIRRSTRRRPRSTRMWRISKPRWMQAPRI